MSRTKRPRRRPTGSRPAPAAPAVALPAMSPVAAIARLVHPFPSLAVAALTAALVPFAAHSGEAGLATQLGIGMLLYQFAIGAANDLADLDLDRVHKPSKPLARGALPPRTARLLTILLAGGGMAVTSTLDLLPWLIGIAGLGCGLVYDLSLKRTALAFVPLCVAVPLIPIWVWSAAGEWDALLWAALPAGGLIGFAIYLGNQVPGSASERASGVEGLAQMLGPRVSVLLGVAAFGLASSVAAVALVLAGEAGRALLVALAALVTVLLAPRSVRFFGRDGLFGVFVASGAAVALVYLSAV